MKNTYLTRVHYASTANFTNYGKHPLLQSESGQREVRGMASDPDALNIISADAFSNLVNVTDYLLQAVCNSKYD